MAYSKTLRCACGLSSLPAQPSPAQALVWALPKFCQRLFLTGFRRPIFGPETAPFLVYFWPVWGRRAAAFPRFEGVALGPRFGSSRHPKPLRCRIACQPKPCQGSAKGFDLPDSEVPFSAVRTLRFWSVFGPFGAAVPLRFPVLRGWLWGLVLGLPDTRSRSGAGLPKLSSLVQPGPGQFSPAQPKPGKALPKAFLTGSRAAILGRRNAPFLPVFGSFGAARCAAAFPCPEGVGLGPCFGCLAGPKPFRCRIAEAKQSSSARPRPVQPGLAQACKPCQSSAKGFVLPDSEVPFSAARTLRFWPVCGRRAAAFPCLEV